MPNLALPGTTEESSRSANCRCGPPAKSNKEQTSSRERTGAECAAQVGPACRARLRSRPAGGTYMMTGMTPPEGMESCDASLLAPRHWRSSSQLVAQDPGRSAPAVTLGPPTVQLGAPCAASAIQPVSFLARGKADDKAPMPTGPTVPNLQPGAGTSTLPAPTPMGEMPSSGPIVDNGPMPDGVFGAPLDGRRPLPDVRQRRRRHGRRPRRRRRRRLRSGDRRRSDVRRLVLARLVRSGALTPFTPEPNICFGRSRTPTCLCCSSPGPPALSTPPTAI